MSERGRFELLRRNAPLWMPRGSIRAIIALTIVFGYFIKTGTIDKDIVMLVLGFYFASRAAGGDKT
ncbi:hypothetical protein [Archaeoglobus profundus]|nr:hypothetical protein [Archaeoglobus profundus]